MLNIFLFFLLPNIFIIAALSRELRELEISRYKLVEKQKVTTLSCSDIEKHF